MRGTGIHRMTKQDVMISIHTERRGVSIPLFQLGEGDLDEDNDGEEYTEALPDLEAENNDEPEVAELLMEGRLVTTMRRAELVYEESELTGMEGAVTKIGFERGMPELISMLRGGSVSTALIFEQGKRHMCVYQTPFASLEVCVQTLEVCNELLTRGTLWLDYLIEIHGARTERCKMMLTIRGAMQDGS